MLRNRRIFILKGAVMASVAITLALSPLNSSSCSVGHFSYDLSFANEINQPASSFAGTYGSGDKAPTSTFTNDFEPAKGTWEKFNGYWRFKDVHGQYLNNTFREIDNLKYRFDQQGRMVTGWFKVNGSWYFFQNNGAMVTGWKKIGNSYYYFYEDGKMAANTTVEGYYISGDGVYMPAGWKQTGDRWWFMNGDGSYPASTEKVIDGGTYYFDSQGYMYTGWLERNGSWRYFTSSGAMVKGWAKINNNWYYFNNNGDMLTNQLIEGWYLDKDGKGLATGWQHNSSGWWFLENDGSFPYSTFKIIDGSTYYFDSNGYMVTGWKQLNGQWYYFLSGGSMAKGRAITGEEEHLFGDDGKWIKQYLIIDDKLPLARQFYSPTNYLILVDTTENHCLIYYWRNGNWQPYYDWLCTTGAYSTPTVKGTFHVGKRGGSFGDHTYTCWYYTQFFEDYLFHSVIYDSGSQTKILDGRLGLNLSHGCVRLPLSKSRWIYNNIPFGTTVYVY